jgi:hypothetical protein
MRRIPGLLFVPLFLFIFVATVHADEVTDALVLYSGTSGVSVRPLVYQRGGSYHSCARVRRAYKVPGRVRRDAGRDALVPQFFRGARRREGRTRFRWDSFQNGH